MNQWYDQCWNIQRHLGRNDIDESEKVQKRALKLSITPMESIPLEQRRLEEDLCEDLCDDLCEDLCDVYKYLSVLNRNNPEHIFYKWSSNLRGHSLKLRKTYPRTEIRKHFFTNRFIDCWNKLPEEVVSALTLNTFKKKLRYVATGWKRQPSTCTKFTVQDRAPYSNEYFRILIAFANIIKNKNELLRL